VTARVIAATSAEPGSLPSSFRPDLATRLGAFTIVLPPLAARRDDIEPLARAFLARHPTGGRSSAPAMTAEFLAALAARDWPDNVRGLRHAVEYAAVVARGGSLRPEHLPQQVASVAGRAAAGSGLASAETVVGAAMKDWAAAARAAYAMCAAPDLHHRALQLVEATLFREALAHTGGNRTAAAKLLGLDRATLRSKLRSLGIDD
jgi:two-component system nitrogen regulation response regulator GlnG